MAAVCGGRFRPCAGVCLDGPAPGGRAASRFADDDADDDGGELWRGVACARHHADVPHVLAVWVGDQAPMSPALWSLRAISAVSSRRLCADRAVLRRPPR